MIDVTGFTFDQAVSSVIHEEDEIIASLANYSSIYMQFYKPHWVGFYLVKQDYMSLGPFQGPMACSKIKKGKGVCGRAWDTKEVQNIADVHQFPGHIACSGLTNSELVIPLIKDGKVWAIFDIDRITYGYFEKDHIDLIQKTLNKLNDCF